MGTADEAKIAEINASTLPFGASALEPAVDLLGDPIVDAPPVPTVEERLAALEAKLESPLDPAELESRLYEAEARFAALEAKLDRIAAGQPRTAHPKTLDELPSPFAQ